MRTVINKAAPIVVLALMLSLVLPPLAGAADGRASQVSQHMVYSSTVADGVSAATGTAISPLVVIFIHGLYNLITAGFKYSSDLPWHAHPTVLAVLGLVLLMVFLKDTVPLGPFKKPLDAVDEGIMTGGALLSLFILLPYLTEMFLPYSELAVKTAWNWFSAAPAWADSGFSAAPAETGTFIQRLSGLLAALAGTVIYVVVWLVSNTINVIGLVAPGFVGTLLKSFRLALVGAIYGLAAIHPLLGLAASLLLFITCLAVAGWSFRLTVWGGIFAFDLIFRRWRGHPALSNRLPAFSGSGLAAPRRLPKRILGFIDSIDGRLVFRYRRFFIFPRTVQLPPAETLMIGRCLAAPFLADRRGGADPLIAFRLRYHGHEDFLAGRLNVSEVKDLGVTAKARGAWQWLKGLWRSGELTDQCECVLTADKT
ncbi:hypothetical protein LJB86_02125 [Deltaproteobacteria bacterium OttesenSCG-928-M10]|nr:hypothetical protein [Deltaproteobacteria bacterium OttesenSCG-928-M10]